MQVTLWRDSGARRLVLAFRGTEQTRWKDLMTDALVVQVCVCVCVCVSLYIYRYTHIYIYIYMYSYIYIYIYIYIVTEALVVQNVFEPGCSLDEEVLNLLALPAQQYKH